MRSSAPTAIFMSAATWGTVARLKDGDLRYQIMPDPTGESRRQLFGIKVFVTPHVGAAVVVADMCAIAVGVRDKMNVFYDPFRYSEFDQSAVRVTSRWDVGVLNPEGIEILTWREWGTAGASGRAPRRLALRSRTDPCA
jgi:HK97 family phage major capsid protein